MLVRQLAQRAQELGTEMVVAALGLDRLEQNAGDLVLALREGAANLGDRVGLGLGHALPLGVVHREAELGRGDARPVEPREVLVLPRVGGVGEREGVAAAAVERLAEVEHLRALLFPVSLAEIAPHLPVERRLERVLHRHGPAGDQEQMGQVIGLGEAREGLDELRHLDRIEVGVAGIRERRPLELGQERRLFHLGMVEADRHRGEAGEEIQEPAVVLGIVEPATVALLQIEDHVVAVTQHVLGDHRVHVGRREAAASLECCGHEVPPSTPVGTKLSSFEVERTMTVRVCRTPSSALSLWISSCCSASMSRTRILSSSENSPVM